MIEIWEPRYKDNKVLIAKHKVMRGDNTIIFTKAKHLKGMVFVADGEEIQQSHLDSNGKIPCYAFPMEKLERVS